MRDAYEYAKKGAADELGVSSPGTKRETLTIINQNAQAVVEKQMADLVFAVKTQVLAEVRKTGIAELSVADVVKGASGAFDGFFMREVALGGSAAVAMAINRGREDVFGLNRDDIAVYQYSAILDGRACPICLSLDKSVVDYAGYRATKWKPPIHLRCRCIWVAIKKDQTEIPSVTGLPDAPGGSSAPSL